MKVWVITSDGMSFVNPSVAAVLMALETDLPEMEDDRVFTITTKEMTRDEYENLNDFEGW